MQPATQPIQLQVAPERVEGLGQVADVGETGVVVQPAESSVRGPTLPVIADTSLWKESKKANGSATTIVLRDGRFSEGLIKIDPDAAGPAADFKAFLHFKISGVERKGLSGAFSLYRVLTDWSEDEANWFKPGSDDDKSWNGLKSGVDYEAQPFAHWQTDNLKDKQIVDVAGMETAVKAWRSGDWPNYGFLLLFNGKAVQCGIPAREVAFKARSLTIGGETGGSLLVTPNLGVLKAVILRPGDLLDATLRLIALKPAKGTEITGATLPSIAVFRALRPISDHPLVAGIDFDPAPLATTILPAPPSSVGDTSIAIPGLTEAIRHLIAGDWKNDGLIVRPMSGTGAPLVVYGLGDNNHAPSFSITLQPAPHAVLYSNELKPRSGIYTILKNGHLYYGDQRLRLWGVVGVPNADRLVKMGFNAERIWNPRTNLAGPKAPSSFYTEASAKRGETVTYTKGDGSMIDQWDAHFADDKAHGIFVMFGALVNGMPIPPLAADDSFIAPGHEGAVSSTPQDWEDWKKAILTPKADLYRISIFDDRLLAIRKRAAKNLLRHVNQYTGKPYGEDEAVALYEVFNENGFTRNALEEDYLKWPKYFGDEFQQKWNAWLKARYNDDAGLLAAWGKMDAGESLRQATVKLGPALSKRTSYPQARGDDFIRFVIEADDRFHQDFRAFCRTQAPPGVGVNVAPFSFDTQYRPHMPWSYTNSLGDVNSFGMYFWDLTSTLTRPPSAYVLDSNTTDGGATVLYETNVGRPNPYRAEYPLRLAAMASWQDWDGIMWHYWSPADTPDESYLTTAMAPPVPTHYWAAVQHQNDPVMCSAMSIAGRMFLNYDIQPALKPAIAEVGGKALFSYEAYNGVGIAQQMFNRGARIRYAPEKQSGVTIDGTAPPEPQRITAAVRSGDEILWDWPNGRLIIDTPNAKAYVGKYAGPFKFKDGIVLGDVNCPFLVFGMASADGKPLSGMDSSRRIYITAIADARNTDFKFDYDVKGGPLEQAHAVSDRGRAPVIVDKVNYTVWFPTTLEGRFSMYDFALRPIGEQSLANSNHISQIDETPYMSVLSVDQRGAPAAVPAVAVVADTPIERMSNTGSATIANSGPWNPIPVLGWAMNYADAHKAIRDSNLVFSSVSKEDVASAAEKMISISDLQSPRLWSTPADLEITFAGDHMTSITATFKQPPPFTDAVADFQKQFGAPVEKQLGTQFERSLAKWDNIDKAISVMMTESQGILKIIFTAK